MASVLGRGAQVAAGAALAGIGRAMTRAATGQRVTLTPVTNGVDGSPTSTFIWANTLSGTSWPGLGDSWSQGMSIPSAWRAATLIADLLAGLPYHAYRKLADRPVERLDNPRPPVLEQPHPPDIAFDTLHAWILDLLWNGNGIGIVASRDFRGVPTALSPVMADQVTIGRSETTGRVTYRIGGAEFDYTDVFHLKGPHKPGELRGKGVLELHMDSLALARDQRAQASGISGAGVPSGIIKSADPDLDDAGAADLKTKWMTATVTRVPMVLNPQTEFEPISWNPEEMQLVESRRLSTEDMALIFGLPAYYLNVANGAKDYANVQDENLQLLRFSSVAGHLARVEGTYSALLPRGTVVRADLDDTILRPDVKTRFEVYAIGKATGIYPDPNEQREWEGLPPMAAPEPELPPEPDPDAPEEGTEDV